jgi:hypothetical protein
MKNVLAILLIIGGVAFGIYFGLWFCFIGGIVQVIEQIRAEHLDAMTVATGLAKVFFATPLGVFAGSIPVLVGMKMID